MGKRWHKISLPVTHLLLVMLISSCGDALDPSLSAYKLSGNNIVAHIWFVRHAETKHNAGWSQEDNAFTDKGWSQTWQLKERLGNMHVYFDRVLISTEWRSIETIKPFLNARGDLYNSSGVVYDGGLVECCYDSAHSSWPAQQAADRLRKEIANSGRSVNVLVVGHYYSGQHFMQTLAGQWSNPQPAEPLYFELRL